MPAKLIGGTSISVPLYVVLGWIVVFGAAAYGLAARRDRRRLPWLVFGAVLGPIALALLWQAPPGRCRSCLTPTRGWILTCSWCHEDVRTIPAGTRAVLARMRGEPLPPIEVPRNDRGRRSSRGRSTGRDTTSHGNRNARARDDAHATNSAIPQQPGIVVDPPARRPEASALATSLGPAHATAEVPVKVVRPSVGATERLGPARGPEPASSWRAGGPTAGISEARTEGRVIGLATYLSGNTALQPGRQYTIVVEGERLRFQGPIDTSPSAVALDLALRGTDAMVVESRLLVAQRNDRGGVAMAFMVDSLTSPARLATAIAEAAAERQ